MRLGFCLSFVCLISFGAIAVNSQDDKLKKDYYYHKNCPLVETIVRDIVWGKVAQNPSLAAKLLRLHYHDCFVRGCDASLLLDSTDNSKAEKTAFPNLSVSGYDIIDEVKTKLEEIYPGIVSCADIVALAARDALRTPLWQVLGGRKDGKISVASEVTRNLPSASANFTTLLGLFESKGLDLQDLVTLSGARPIGVSHCGTISRRLYNFTGNGDTDPSIEPNYAKYLKTQSTLPTNPNSTVKMDPTISSKFDSHYYKVVSHKMGLFSSDASLLTNQKSSCIVKLLENPNAFFTLPIR